MKLDDIVRAQPLIATRKTLEHQRDHVESGSVTVRFSESDRPPSISILTASNNASLASSSALNEAAKNVRVAIRAYVNAQIAAIDEQLRALGVNV